MKNIGNRTASFPTDAESAVGENAEKQLSVSIEIGRLGNDYAWESFQHENQANLLSIRRVQDGVTDLVGIENPGWRQSWDLQNEEVRDAIAAIAE